MSGNIFKIIIVFIVGAAGGVLGGQVFNKYIISEDYPVSITENKEIIVQENTALQDAVEKVKNSLIGIETKLSSGKIISGSGLALTSDGLMVTLSELVPKGTSSTFFVDGKNPEYKVLKKDQNLNLALLKLEEDELQSCGFSDPQELRLGQRVFLLGMIFPESGKTLMANQGIVKYFTGDYIRTNIFETKALSGSVLFNIKGELIGLNFIDSQGVVTAIPVDRIRGFIGL